MHDFVYIFVIQKSNIFPNLLQDEFTSDIYYYCIKVMFN